MFKIKIVKNTVSEYLDLIDKNIEENAPKQLKHMAEKLVGEYDDPTGGYIAPLMSTTWNPNMFLSGQDEDYWKILNDDDKHSLTVTYTGLRLYDLYSMDEAKVWWEFAVNQEADPQERVLERDYAFFQETGIDRYALPKYAKHKGAVAHGVRAGKGEMYEMATKYLENIMNRGSGYFFM